MNKKISIFLFAILLSATAHTKNKMRIAIIDFQAKDISQKDANKITELIRNEIINVGRFVVVERAQMSEILKEQGFQQTGCTDISCAVEMGKILSARKMLIGTVLKLAGKTIITGRIVDVESSVAEFSEKGIAGSEGELSSTVTRYVEKLVKKIEKAEEKTMAEKGLYKQSNPWTIPAFGVTALGLSSLGGGLYFNSRVKSLQSDYDSLYIKYMASTSTIEADKLHRDMTVTHDDAEKASLYRNIAYGIGAASIFAGSFFLYKFFTFTPTYVKSQGESMTVEPLMFSSIPNIRSSSEQGGYFFGGGIILRF